VSFFPGTTALGDNEQFSSKRTGKAIEIPEFGASNASVDVTQPSG
jgi:hypothetical protein